MAKLEPYKGDFYLWHYLPSIPGAVIFAILFLIIAVLQSYKLYKTKAYFCICFVIASFFEVIGYVVRITARDQTSKLLPYLLQSIFILLAPALFAASIYMALGHMIRFLHAEHLSPIRINWLTKAFVLGDWLSFMIQGNSSSLTFKPSTQKIGEGLIVAGLFVQIISFGLFFLTSVVFHRRIRKSPTHQSLTTEVNWLRILWMLYVVSIFILLRSIFRVVEYIMGYDGYLFVNEWTLYVFDAIPMWIVCVAFWWCWPDQIRVKRSDRGDIELNEGSRLMKFWLPLRKFRR